ncbi:Ig-like domain-containing protein [Pantoea sp. DY-5]|uniref:Ig-like domain-containing protein n=1 Tax=Pantoea sp. DY-5 TaxID=2871488 RepID=UPI001C950F04|nr:Ig-like domain-containing protein [Pantoea sp. DY-5]MBY4839043.1 Ig-like domain-containing protein [Pantoea sp. DY-5]
MDHITCRSATRAEGPSRWTRRFVFAQIAVQVGMALTPFWALTVEAATRSDEDAALSTTAQQASSLAQAQQSSSLGGYLSQQATSAAAGQAQQWLEQFGTARVEFGVDEHFKPQTGSLDLLLPLSQSPERLFFTQQGLRNKDGQITGNLGLGQRHFTDRWMFGYNAFYDQNFSRGHKRMGVGAEAWRDYLKLSGNGYYGLSDWRDSGDVEDYDARPAHGFDLRAESWLPAYPAIGGRFMYEKYYGNEVALFSKDKRQSNPAAFTAGLSYTPVPLVSLTLDHKKGGSQSESQIGLQLNYQLGQPLAAQLDPNAVKLGRTLAANRMALVERNNNIVLEYRKQEVIQLGLPAEISGRSGKTVELNYKVISKHGLAAIIWNDAELLAAGGRINDLGNNQYQIVLPRFVAGGKNSYTLSGVAVDTRKNRSKVSSTLINVDSPAVSTDASTISASPDVLLADGKSTSQVSIVLRDESGQPITDLASAIQLTATTADTAVKSKARANVAAAPAQPPVLSAVTEKGNGEYQATLTAGTRVANITLSASIDAQQINTLTIKQISDAASAVVADGDLRMLLDSMVANGNASARAQARVTDATGNPVAGVTVTFALSGSAQVAAGSALTAVSDENGYVAVAFTDTVAEAITVTATTANGGSAKVEANFIADAATATLDKGSLTADRTTAVADGGDKVTFNALIKDANGNAVSGVKLNWHSNGGTLSAASSQSGKDGIAAITLSDTVAHEVQVQAQLGTQAALDAPKVNFTADVSSAGIDSRDFIADKTHAVADGSDTVTYTLTVKDKNGNLLAGQSVNWQATLGTLSGVTSITGADGKAQVKLTSTQMGLAGVTATLPNKPAVSAVAVTFAADASSARIDSGSLTVDKTSITAGTTDAATFRAVVKDANDNPVANLPVNWATNSGTLSGIISTTNAAGEATITLTATQAGSVQVTARVNSSAPVNAPPVTVMADVSGAQIGSGDITADKASAIANSGEKITYSATVKDAYGNLLQNVQVNWTTDRGDLVKTTSMTNASGIARAELSSKVLSSAIVSAQPGSGSAVAANTVEFIADVSSAALAAGDLTVDTVQLLADDSTPANYTAMVKDQYGNVVKGVSIHWGTNFGKLAVTNSITDQDGKATAALRSNAAGKAVVTATLNGTTVNASEVEFVLDTVAATITVMNSSKDTVYGFGTQNPIITVEVYNPANQPIPNYKVNWSTTLGTIGGESITNDKGKATITLNSLLENQDGGIATIEATLPNGNKKTLIQRIYPVYKVGNSQYVSQSIGGNTTRADASAQCASIGAKLAGSAQLAEFASAGGDFAEARMLMPNGRFSYLWHHLSSSWDGAKGNFDSTSGTVGDKADKNTGIDAVFVCYN